MSITYLSIYSQIKEPMVWLNGYQNPFYDTSQVDTGFNQFFAGNYIDFRGNSVSVSKIKNSLSTDKCVINMCDSAGNFLFYSNGSKVFNYEHRLIEGGDSINYYPSRNEYDSGYYACYYNGRGSEHMMAFPHPNKKNQFYLISIYYNIDTPDLNGYISYTNIHYTLLDMSLNGGKGKVLTKNQVIIRGRFASTVSACKHANGKDWWIFVPYDSSDCMVRLKLDSLGVSVDEARICMGWDRPQVGWRVYSSFSPDGKKFALGTMRGVELYDFDRCSGTFSNRQSAENTLIDTNYNKDDIYSASLCFSPNSKLLYVCYNIWVYQFETNSKDLLGSAVRVATYDGFMNGFHTFIEKPQIAPNGKIYICTGNSTRYLHTIEKPNEKGLACDLRQHSFRLKTFNTGVPHFPFYSLGADTCYTTSISSPRSEYEIKIYPNPANEYLTIKNESKTKEDLEIEIVDLLGKKVMSKKSFNEKIDIRNIENGVYFIMLKNKEGEIIYKEKLRISK